MADALNVKKISAFTDNTAPADTDCFLTATGNVAKKTTVSQLIAWLKEKLGINDLNTNLLKVKELGVSASVSAQHFLFCSSVNFKKE